MNASPQFGDRLLMPHVQTFDAAGRFVSAIIATHLRAFVTGFYAFAEQARTVHHRASDNDKRRTDA